MRVFITGGTGTLGRAIMAALLEGDVEQVVLMGHSPGRTAQARRELAGEKRVSVEPGDVNAPDLVRRLCRGMDAVIHCAANKHIELCEAAPLQAVRTNVDGTRNVIGGCFDRGVGRLLHISTDKAVEPCSLYGATKLCADRLVLAANNHGLTKCSVLRLGNIFGSAGSVLEVWKGQHERGEPLTITNVLMTRFAISKAQAGAFAAEHLLRMEGGELFIPEMPTILLGNLRAALYPDDETREIGPRRGERHHEILATIEEAEQYNETLGPVATCSHTPHYMTVEETRTWLNTHIL